MSHLFWFKPVLLIFFLTFSISSYADEIEQCLAQINNNAHLIKQCKVDQVMPDECEHLLQPSILVTLSCAQKGATNEQINDAILTGESQVEGDEAQSPYRKVQKIVTSAPYHLHPEPANFIVYSKHCSEYKEKLFRIAARVIKNRQARFIVTPVKPKTCLTTTNLHKKYPVLSEAQLEKFTRGEYLEQSTTAERVYDFIDVMQADSMAEAGKFFSALNKKVRLTIDTSPADASVKIFGIDKPYKRGMKLNVGRYKVRVTRSTYIPKELTINLTEKNTQFQVQLQSSIEILSCLENETEFPMELTNRYYLEKINNCTYKIKSPQNSRIPFKMLVAKNTHEKKHLLLANLGIMQMDKDGQVSSLGMHVLKPRVGKVKKKSSGIGDVPEALVLNMDNEKIQELLLTILDATFSLD
jgi:hypothetical protein